MLFGAYLFFAQAYNKKDLDKEDSPKYYNDGFLSHKKLKHEIKIACISNAIGIWDDACPKRTQKLV